MNGYLFFVISIFFLVVISPRQGTNVRRLFLSTDKIAADRTSPAFSAIEDAFIIKELLDHQAPKKEKKMDLKGIKLSLNQKPFNLEKVDLRGELIEVAHFTNKFIANKIVNKNIELALNGLATKNIFVGKKSRIIPSQVKAYSLANSMSNTVKLFPDKVKVLKDEQVILSKAVLADYTANIITGSIFLEGEGNFFGDDFYYYINRNLDGRIYESGVVDAEQNVFKMEIGAVKGILSVELRSEKGDVLAYGEHILNDVEQDLENLNIQIFPSKNLFNR